MKHAIENKGTSKSCKASLVLRSLPYAGVVFRFLGRLTHHPLLGVKVVATTLMFATVSGILMTHSTPVLLAIGDRT
ncbi:unnamed protein product [Victoria cruziana]